MDFSNLLEYLVPILFLIIFVISKALGKRTQDESEEDKGDREGDRSPPFFDLEDVQEEIRRKIQERQEAQPPIPLAKKVEKQPNVQQRPVFKTKQTTQKPSAPVKRNYQREIAQQLQKAKEAKLRVESIRAQSKLKTKEHYAKRRQTGVNIGIAREIIQNAHSARKGFIAYEIFGTPLALRDNNKIKPSWD